MKRMYATDEARWLKRHIEDREQIMRDLKDNLYCQSITPEFREEMRQEIDLLDERNQRDRAILAALRAAGLERAAS
jgi:hypothetical protein